MTRTMKPSRAERYRVSSEFVAELAELKFLVQQIRVEIRELRNQRLPASVESLTALLGAIHQVFGDAPFAAAWLLEAAIDGDPDSVRLRETLIQILGPKPTVGKLSRLLRRSGGRFGSLRLTIAQQHSRDGNLYVVTK